VLRLAKDRLYGVQWIGRLCGWAIVRCHFFQQSRHPVAPDCIAENRTVSIDLELPSLLLNSGSPVVLDFVVGPSW